MSNDDIEDVFLRNCCYPGCSQEMFMCPQTCGYQYPLCKTHIGNKLYLADGLLSSHTDDIGTPSELNIWYKNRVIAKDRSDRTTVEVYISLYGCDNLIRFVYVSPKDTLYAGMIHIKDKYAGWYDYDHFKINLTLGYYDIHTYKYKLYNMRDSYFGAMPRDILDEVIKYL